MKRFRRILFNTLTAISLLLALATAGLWVMPEGGRARIELSCRTTVRAGWAHHDGVELTLTRDWLAGKWIHECESVFDKGYVPSAKTSPLGYQFEQKYEPHGNGDSPKGFSFSRSRSSSVLFSDYVRANAGFDMATIPSWFAFSAFLIVPVLWLMLRTKSARRLRQSNCPACGYDMRANPAKCSECGHEPTLAGDGEGKTIREP